MVKHAEILNMELISIKYKSRLLKHVLHFRQRDLCLLLYFSDSLMNNKRSKDVKIVHHSYKTIRGSSIWWLHAYNNRLIYSVLSREEIIPRAFYLYRLIIMSMMFRFTYSHTTHIWSLEWPYSNHMFLYFSSKPYWKHL